MSRTMLPSRERLEHLLADRALFGLSDEEREELRSLEGYFPDMDTDCFDRIVVSVDLALGSGRFEPMPNSLRTAIRKQAVGHSS
jgi:hypothetical protein